MSTMHRNASHTGINILARREDGFEPLNDEDFRSEFYFPTELT